MDWVLTEQGWPALERFRFPGCLRLSEVHQKCRFIHLQCADWACRGLLCGLMALQRLERTRGRDL